MYGDINPGKTPIIPHIPRTTPEKFGLISTTLAKAPVDTAPCRAVAIVRKITAIVESHPEYAIPITKSPFRIEQTNVANFLTFVVDILSVLNK